MAQQLRAFAALTEDMVLVPSTYTAAYRASVTPVPVLLMSSSEFQELCNPHSAYSCVQTHKIAKLKTMTQAWWHMPLIPKLGTQRQEDL